LSRWGGLLRGELAGGERRGKTKVGRREAKGQGGHTKNTQAFRKRCRVRKTKKMEIGVYAGDG